MSFFNIFVADALLISVSVSIPRRLAQGEMMYVHE